MGSDELLQPVQIVDVHRTLPIPERGEGLVAACDEQEAARGVPLAWLCSVGVGSWRVVCVGACSVSGPRAGCGCWVATGPGWAAGGFVLWRRMWLVSFEEVVSGDRAATGDLRHRRDPGRGRRTYRLVSRRCGCAFGAAAQGYSPPRHKTDRAASFCCHMR